MPIISVLQRSYEVAYERFLGAVKVSSAIRVDSESTELFIPVEQVSLTRFLQRNSGHCNEPTVITPDTH